MEHISVEKIGNLISGDNNDEEICLKKSGTKYYEVVHEPHYCISRKIFGIPEKDFTQFERDKLIKFKEAFQKDRKLEKKIKSNNLEEFFYSFVLKRDENVYRYLNLFSYDYDKTISNFYKLIEILKKLKITSEVLNKEDKQSKDFSICYLYGKDISNRPIIAFDAAQFVFIKKMFTFTSDIVKVIFNSVNKVLDKELISGQIEQFTLFLKLENIKQSELDIEMIKLFQFLYPSRLHKMFVLSDSNSNLTKLQNSFLSYNLNRMTVMHSNSTNAMRQVYQVSQVSSEIDIELIHKFFFEKIKFCEIEEIDINGSKLENEYKEIGQILPQRQFTENNLETDSHTKENIEENIEENISISKNFSNSSWLNNITLKIDYCDVLSFNKITQNLCIMSCNSFTIKNKPKLSLNRLNRLNREITAPVIFTRYEDPVICAKFDECSIL